ncbi:MAG: alkyl hydroperoxide reductase [Clostridiales bacterium]|nr:alkyl hydroperoxide reductase [Clostridiales bacterium]
MYYAIHGFNFLKTTNSIVITDRYDYELSDMGGLEGIAVNTMYYAQVIGVIVPYDVVIN